MFLCKVPENMTLGDTPLPPSHAECHVGFHGVACPCHGVAHPCHCCGLALSWCGLALSWRGLALLERGLALLKRGLAPWDPYDLC